jgi:hypothetical protein
VKLTDRKEGRKEKMKSIKIKVLKRNKKRQCFVKKDDDKSSIL